MDPDDEVGVHLMRLLGGCGWARSLCARCSRMDSDTDEADVIVAAHGLGTTTRRKLLERVGFWLYAQHHVGTESNRSSHVCYRCGNGAFDRHTGERQARDP